MSCSSGSTARSTETVRAARQLPSARNAKPSPKKPQSPALSRFLSAPFNTVPATPNTAAYARGNFFPVDLPGIIKTRRTYIYMVPSGPFDQVNKDHLLKRRKMKLTFLLSFLLLTACSASAVEGPSKEKDALLLSQTSVTEFGNENESPFELLLLLGAMAFPVALICSYEVYQSICARRLFPSDSLRAVNASLVSRDMGNVRCLWSACIL